MRKIHKWIICVMFIISCTVLFACGNKNGEADEKQLNSGNAEVDTTVIRPIEITDVSDTEKEIYVFRDDLKLYGKLFLPDGEGPFPVVVFSSGAGMPFGKYKSN